MPATVTVISISDLDTLPRGCRSLEGLAVYQEWWTPSRRREPRVLRTSPRPQQRQQRVPGGRRAGEGVGGTADPRAHSKPRVACGPTRHPGHLCEARPPWAAVQRAAAEGWGCRSEGATGWWTRLCVSLPRALLSLALFSIPACTQALTIQPPCRHPSQREPCLRRHSPGLP